MDQNTFVPVTSRLRSLLASRPVWGILAGLALVAFTAWLRLRDLGYTEMWPDQSLTITMALEWVRGGSLPLASIPSSVGFNNPPLIEYLFAIPLAIAPSVMGPLWLTAIVNLAGVLVAGWATARVFGWRVAWWSTLLFAVNPWAVYYGRLIWMQDFVPGFASVVYACVILYFTTDRRPVYLVLAAVFLAAAIQVHLSAAALGVSLVLVGIALCHRLRWKPLAVGAALFVLTFAPFLVFEIKNGFPDLATLQSSAGQPVEVDFSSGRTALDLLQSGGIFATLGQAEDHWRRLGLGWLQADVLVAVVVGLSIIAAGAALAGGWRRSGRWRDLDAQSTGRFILLAWLIVPVLFFIRHSYPLQTYYFLYLFPVPLVLMALAAEQLYGWLSARVAGWLPWRPASAVLAGVAFLPLAVIGFQQARLNIMGQDLLVEGRSGQQRVIDVQRAIDTARDLMAGQPGCQLVVVSEAPEYGSSRFGLLREFLKPVTVRFAQAGGRYLAPSPCAVYFVVVDDPQTLAWLRKNTKHLPARAIKTPEQTWRFYTLSEAGHAAVLARCASPAVTGEWSQGMRLHRANVTGDLRPGKTLRITQTWTVGEDNAAHRKIYFGSYLLAQDNQLVAQIDGPAADSPAWQAGDCFQTVYNLPLPADLKPDHYRVATALYYFPEVKRLPLARPDPADGEDLLIWGDVSISPP